MSLDDVDGFEGECGVGGVVLEPGAVGDVDGNVFAQEQDFERNAILIDGRTVAAQVWRGLTCSSWAQLAADLEWHMPSAKATTAIR